ncbi:DUF262 domain-containing protein [Paenibacillus sp. Y412MC10]|uniref:GmrSD restriction endonuclease domain-containing protein n=1 Tax=Geobacillus sp. (strain Y412MC10) TaxID=481743 RepID=UPI0011AB771A|nr:DUF262 domain-containing protein [Paenibacillus sp. Y412MC10]
MLSIKMNPSVPIVTMDQMNGFFDFGLEATARTWTVAEYMERPSVFIMDDPIQRNNTVWSLEKATEMITSLLERVSIGSIKTQVVQNVKQKRRNYIVLDGAQRMTRIRDYVRGNYPLQKLRYAIEDENGEAKKDENGQTMYVEGVFIECVNDNGDMVYLDIAGLQFKELPSTLQNRIMSYNFTVEEYHFEDDEIKKVLFYRWNNGESLTPTEKLKSKLSDQLLVAAVALKKFDVFKAGLTEKKIHRDENLMAILQAMAVICTDNNTGLSMKVIEAIHYDFDTTVIEKAKIAGEYLNKVYASIENDKTRKAIFNKTKTIALMYVVSKANEEGILPEDHLAFADWAKQYYVNEAAVTSATSGTTSSDRVKARNSAPLTHLRKYFAESRSQVAAASV